MTKARTVSRLVVALLIAIGVSVGLAGSAAAHNVLISSNPADNATVSTAPSSISFTFDQPIQNFDPVVSLVGPDGRQYATGTPVISGNVITGTVNAGPAGSYTAAYRIVSADGHPVTGEINFTLAGDDGAVGSGVPGSGTAVSEPAESGVATAPASTAGATAAPSAGSAPAPAPTSSSGLSAWLWIGLIVAAVVIAVAAVLLLRRPARDRSPEDDY